MESLIKPLLIGDYGGALAVLYRLESDRSLARLRAAGEAGRALPDHLAAPAELFFYVGRNEEARSLLSKFELDWQRTRVLTANATARTRLQVAECFYSREDFTRAHDVASATLVDARHGSDVLGVAEASYYLMRIARRLHKYDEVIRHRHGSIDAFSTAATACVIDKAVLRWRLGLVSLMTGFTRYRVGELESAMSFLQTAACLLDQGGDFIARANVRHTIGTIFRSAGKVDDALRELEAARDLYSPVGHQLNLSRVQTDIGRVYIDGSDWRNAQEALAAAEQVLAERETVVKLRQPKGVEKQLSRHRAEVLLWKSWLAQNAPVEIGAGNLNQALEWAEKVCTAKSPSMRLEGHIAAGYGLAKLSMLPYAEEEFNTAYSIAKGSEMTRHLANAALSLADFYSRYSPSGLNRADQLYDEANLILSRVSSAFLHRKAHAIGKQIADTMAAAKRQGSALFIRSFDEVVKDGIKATRQSIQQWTFDCALRKTGNDFAKAADLLKIEYDTFHRTHNRQNVKGDKATPSTKRSAAQRPSSIAGKRRRR